jgi:hypothetical protein
MIEGKGLTTKCRDVIFSCKNEGQLKVAKKFCRLAVNKRPHDYYLSVEIEKMYILKRFILQIGYERKVIYEL